MSKPVADLALDSNAAIAYIRGNPAAVQWVESAASLFLPVTCLGELWYGALHSQRVDANLAKIQALADLCAIIEITGLTAQRYGELRQALAQQGTPIPEADMWIAAICLEYGLPLLTDDVHLRRIAGLDCIDWTTPPNGA